MVKPKHSLLALCEDDVNETRLLESKYQNGRPVSPNEKLVISICCAFRDEGKYLSFIFD